MNPNNFVPSSLSRQRQVNYTDGSPSREVEDVEEEQDEEMEKFKKGFAYKKTSILDVRDALCNLSELVAVASAALMAPHPYTDPIKVYGVLQLEVIPRIKELEQELAKL